VNEQLQVPVAKRKAVRKTEVSHAFKRRRALNTVTNAKTQDKKPNHESALTFNSNQYSGEADNIDECDAKDPLCTTDYVQDMYEHFRSKEASTSARPLFMENQPHINEHMRSILIDWLVEKHLKFKLFPDTLFLAVNLLDRYLEQNEVSSRKLKLVGVTCLFIASKYEEIYCLELRDVIPICEGAYTNDEVRFRLKM
jgi:cyclin B